MNIIPDDVVIGFLALILALLTAYLFSALPLYASAVLCVIAGLVLCIDWAYVHRELTLYRYRRLVNELLDELEARQ